MNISLSMPLIYKVACHTDNIGKGSTFVAIKGHRQNGLVFVPQALKQGASTIVIEHSEQLSNELEHSLAKYNAQVMRVADARLALAHLSAQEAGYPAQKLHLLAITGTKGKTTSAFLLEHVLRTAGYKTALLSTVKNKIGNQEFVTNLTTQHPDYLHNFFSLCVDAGVEYVVMEVAAQATSLRRTAGLMFDGLIFTNFDQEHAEFYPSMQEYFAAKVVLIDQLKPGAPLLLNADDPWVNPVGRHYSNALAFGIVNQDVDFHACVEGNTLMNLSLTLAHKNQTYQLDCPALIGSYNAYNVLGVTSLATQLGLTYAQINAGLQSFGAVPGRLEGYELPNGSRCFIDYAHNPSSYQAVLSMMRSMTNDLIVVFGAGGERDKTKRPIMGAVAAQFADCIILTSDNPRSEEAAIIVQEILDGIDDIKKSKVIIELDRKKAILAAYKKSQTGSVIMLLGKGPDEYQIIGNQKLPFSERTILAELK